MRCLNEAPIQVGNPMKLSDHLQHEATRFYGLTCALFCILGITFAPSAIAQYGTAQTLASTPLRSSDLKFAAQPAEMDSKVSLSNALFAPKFEPGEKLPALIIFHTCGGIREEIRGWAQDALKEKYVVLTVDAMRGMPVDCGSPPGVPHVRYVKDALDAAAHLAGLPFVDSSRISILGFSRGALVATWLASSNVAGAIRSNAPKISASVALYPLCGIEPGPRTPPGGFLVLQEDTDRPLLILMGGKDTETPPPFCLDRLQKLADKKAPVQWHLYPEATHCWDCASLDGYTKTSPNFGTKIVYKFDPQITGDSRTRIFSFLKQANLK